MKFTAIFPDKEKKMKRLCMQCTLTANDYNILKVADKESCLCFQFGYLKIDEKMGMCICKLMSTYMTK